MFSRCEDQLFVMFDQLMHYLFDFVISFRYEVFCNVFVMNVINVCIELKFFLSQKKKNILLNSIFELFERLKWIHCFHFNNHLKQLTFIDHDFFKFTIAFMKKNLKLSKHSKKIQILLWIERFFAFDTSQKVRCRQHFVNIIKHKYNWKSFASSNNDQTNLYLHLKNLATIIYLINISLNSNSSQMSILFMNDRFARKMMNRDEIHYCLYIRRKLDDMRTCDVQKGIIASHRRIREIRHDYYLMSMTHETFFETTSINVCSIIYFDNKYLRTTFRTLTLWLTNQVKLKMRLARRHKIE